MNDLICLALLVYFEARDQDLHGQAAVAHVVLNRVEDPRWPDNICEVVTDGGTIRNRCQFSFYCDGLEERPANARAWRFARTVATLVLAGAIPDRTGRATHYFAPKWVSEDPYWVGRLEPTAVIGSHMFYKE